MVTRTSQSTGRSARPPAPAASLGVEGSRSAAFMMRVARSRFGESPKLQETGREQIDPPEPWPPAVDEGAEDGFCGSCAAVPDLRHAARRWRDEIEVFARGLRAAAREDRLPARGVAGRSILRCIRSVRPAPRTGPAAQWSGLGVALMLGERCERVAALAWNPVERQRSAAETGWRIGHQ